MKKLLAMLAAAALAFAPITVMGTEGSNDVTGNTSAEKTEEPSESTSETGSGSNSGSASGDVTGDDSGTSGDETGKDSGNTDSGSATGDVSGDDSPTPTPIPDGPDDELAGGYYSNNCWMVVQPGTVPDDTQEKMRKLISENEDFIAYTDQEFKFYNIKPADHTPGKEVKVQVSFSDLDPSKPVYVLHYNPSDPENQKNWIVPTVSGTTVSFTYDEFSPFLFVYSKKPEQTSSAAASSTASTSTVTSSSYYNPALDKGATWTAADGSLMTSLGDGRYYNQFYTVFDGEGNIVGKYNTNTGAVSPVKASAGSSGGSYVVPNTADKN